MIGEGRNRGYRRKEKEGRTERGRERASDSNVPSSMECLLNEGRD